jgi:hypothetical protein
VIKRERRKKGEGKERDVERERRGIDERRKRG